MRDVGGSPSLCVASEPADSGNPGESTYTRMLMYCTRYSIYLGSIYICARLVSPEWRFFCTFGTLIATSMLGICLTITPSTSNLELLTVYINYFRPSDALAFVCSLSSSFAFSRVGERVRSLGRWRRQANRGQAPQRNGRLRIRPLCRGECT